jgi:hypothetical protein
MRHVAWQQPGCNTITIIATPTSRRFTFATRIEGSDHILVASTIQPLLDSARRLLEQGFDPNLTLVLRHAGSSTNALSATVGVAARLSVAEPDRGSPHFRPWRPYSSSPGASPIRQSASSGTSIIGDPSADISAAAGDRS